MRIERSKNTVEQLQSLKIGKGIQYLLNEARRILGNPVLVHDMDYKLIACTENIVTDDPIWNEFVTNGSVNPERIEFYKNEDFLDMVASAPKITYLRSDKLKYDRIFTKLFNSDNIQIGCAVIKETHRSFDDNDLTLFEIFCDKLNKEIARSEYYRNYGQAYQEILIKKLIERSIEDKGIYTAHVESIYINLKTHLNLAVVDIGRCDPTHRKLVYFQDLFKRRRPDFKYAIVNNHIVILISFERPDSDIRGALKKLNRIFKKENLYIGISGSFENLFELQRYYVEAVEALNYGLKANGAERIYLHAEMRGSQA